MNPVQSKKSVLGKGMAALLGDTLGSLETTKTIQGDQGTIMAPLSEILINPGQPRKVFKEKEIEELAGSIKENGIIQPLIVSYDEEQKKYHLIAGERRYRAAKILGLEYVPVVLKRGTKKDRMIMSIIENVQRQDLNCVEEALAYYQLMEEFHLTQEEVAKKVGKERSTVANILRLLKLPKEVVMMLQKELLSFGHAKVLASLKDDKEILRAANACVAKHLSVRELEQIAKNPGSTGPIGPTSVGNKFFEEKMDIYQQKLERKTNYKVKITSKPSGKGAIQLSFQNENEFKEIFEYLMGLK